MCIYTRTTPKKCFILINIVVKKFDHGALFIIDFSRYGKKYILIFIYVYNA